MPSLAEVQRAFAAALRDSGEAPPPSLRPRGAVNRRFNVYRNNMTVSLVDALKSTFPAVHRLVGEEYFAAAARAYIDRYPPRSPVLLLYGREFDSFLAEELPSAAGVPYLGDVARLEWSRINALHAADAKPAGIEALADVPEDRMSSVKMSLHPSLLLVESRWPVVSLWSATVAPGDGDEVNMREAEQAVVVRPALRVGVHKLAPGAHAFLNALKHGGTLGAAAGHAIETAAGFDLAGQLQFIFQIGAVTAVNLANKDNEP